MASSNKDPSTSESKIADGCHRKHSASPIEEEVKRLKMHLQQATKKNKDLEEKLLLATQELEKEKANSREIVLALTKRLMESREMINQLEVENMRNKKDCMLAVGLLQCNKRVDQGRVSSAMKKLSGCATKPQVGLSTCEKPSSTIKEVKSTTRNTNEIPAQERKILQLTKSSETSGEKTSKNNREKVTSKESAPLSEEEPREGLNVNEVERSLMEGRPSVGNNTPLGGRGTLLKQAKSLRERDTLSAPSKKRDPASEPDQENTPLIQDDIPVVEDATRSLTKKTRFAEDSKLMAREAESFAKEETFLPEGTSFTPLRQKGQRPPQNNKPLVQENKLVITQDDGTPTQINYSLKDEDIEQTREKSSLFKQEIKSLPSGHSTLPTVPLAGESFKRASPIVDNQPTTEETGLLAGEKKLTVDDDSPLNDEKLLTHGEGETEGISSKEAGESPMQEVTPELASFTQEEVLHEEDQTSLVENYKQLVIDPISTKQIKGMLPREEEKPLTRVDRSTLTSNTPSTVESSSLVDENTATDKETEDDTFLAEEDTPLV